ncbi:TIGR04104 family putative zinc finger protein [Alteribacter natronophilus]|uniref:TIGR04104 family putative zinc finger protein n=1 Tax=Alteribacter natronophilus TaxID=2583810 RepID=UPI00110D7A19|nr:TIGR04104 family putative zinc finger protein [Alteribacter natronophilus]TMW71040.1 hypothetical protein FGB90_13810 [Alteribacter natronophilus]
MPTCEGCCARWTWRETMNSQRPVMEARIVCPRCGARQYLKKKSQRQFFYLTLLMLVLMFMPGFTTDSAVIRLTFVFFPPLLVFFLIPFVMEVSIEEGEIGWK